MGPHKEIQSWQARQGELVVLKIVRSKGGLSKETGLGTDQRGTPQFGTCKQTAVSTSSTFRTRPGDLFGLWTARQASRLMGMRPLYLLAFRLRDQPKFSDKKSVAFGEAKLCKFGSPVGSYASSRRMTLAVVAALACSNQHLASRRRNTPVSVDNASLRNSRFGLTAKHTQTKADRPHKPKLTDLGKHARISSSQDYDRKVPVTIRLCI